MTNGYPDEDELAEIENWKIGAHQDGHALMAFVRGLWAYPERFGDGAVSDMDGRRVYVASTGGWSGNESLIAALEKHPTFWMLYWRMSRRGGHYEFAIPEGA